jgi:hypothetical protein
MRLGQIGASLCGCVPWVHQPPAADTPTKYLVWHQLLPIQINRYLTPPHPHCNALCPITVGMKKVFIQQNDIFVKNIYLKQQFIKELFRTYTEKVDF